MKTKVSRKKIERFKELLLTDYPLWCRVFSSNIGTPKEALSLDDIYGYKEEKEEVESIPLKKPS